MLVAVALLLSGCSEGGQKANDDDPFVDPVDTKEGTGAIRGIVLDPTVNAVEGATVVVVGAERDATTDEAGRFTFTDLEPGSYFLKVSKPGWSEAQQSVDVVADRVEPPIVKVLLEQIPGTEPRVETLKLDGFIACSVGEPTNDHSCDTGGEQITQLVFPLSGRPQWIQTEIHWESTQPAGDNLYVIQGVCACDGTRPSFDQRFNESADATSLYVARADPGFLASVDAGGAAKELWVDVSSSGPALSTGLALNQDFTVYATFFYNMGPVSAEWTFHGEGEHPEP